jgi:nucleoside-diphosphate-sugar epimerase
MSLWVIVGCGYTGERLAARLGAATVTTRRPERAAALAARGLDARVLDPFDEAALRAALAPGCVVVDSVPTDPRGPHTPALARAAAAAGARRIVYLSSTAVYGARGRIDEDTPAEPANERGRARLAEERGLAGPVEHVVLRVAAIWGPGRGLEERLRAGGYRVVGDGAGHVSRIHVEDLVSVIVAAGAAPRVSPLYVVGDDQPTTVRAHADAVAAALGLPPPPSIAAPDAPAITVEMQGGDRRVDNRRMKQELGVALRYPRWRQNGAATPT